MSHDKNTLDSLRIDRAQAPRGISFLVVLLLLLLSAAGVGGGYLWWASGSVPRVRTAAVEEKVTGGRQTLLNGSGYVTARREATISSKITGKVVDVLVEEGMKVTSGQVLARLDDSNVTTSLRLAEAQWESARKASGETRAKLEQAERDLTRLTRLLSQESATPLELERAETEAKSLRAKLELEEAQAVVAEREVGVWKQQLEDTVIRAPFAGVVTSKNAQPGEMISPMSSGGFTRTGICTVVDMSSLEIEVDVSESYINRVVSDQRVEVTLDSYPNWKIPAKVIAIIPTADRQKATVRVRVGFEKLDPRILPDMSVKVAFQSREPASAVSRSIRIPQAAARTEGDRTVVWVVREGRVEQRAIVVGLPEGDTVPVEAGLSGGERVVIEGGEVLQDGQRVKEPEK